MDDLTLSSLTSLAANVAFPMVVAGYLLIRMEKKMDDLTAAVAVLNSTIRTLRLPGATT